jgi:holin-like protein
MIPALVALLVCQLAGEAATRALSLPLPGPVLGLMLLLAAFAVWPRLLETVRPVAQGVLGHLSLLFVPAGVGVVGHLDKLGSTGLPILLALVASTVLAIAAGALTFAAVARWTGANGDEEGGPHDA